MPGDPFYWSHEWRTFRASILRERPRCQAPGCPSASKHVDHIISRRRGGAPFDRRNVQALCASCHSRLTAKYDGGFGNQRKGGKANVPGQGCDINGRSEERRVGKEGVRMGRAGGSPE